MIRFGWNIKLVYNILLCLLFVAFAQQSFGQKLVISNFKVLPTDISAREFEELDVNDEPCALLKIYTGIKNIKVDGNRGITKMVEKEGEVWIWLSHGTRQIKISKDGYAMVPYYFDNELEKSTVYALELANDEVFPIVINTGNDVADVFINGKKYASNTTLPGFSAGNYPVEISKLGFKSIDDTISVDKANLYFAYRLERTKQYKFKISSNPAGAILILNGQPVGTTDHISFYYPGEYRVQLSLKEYLPLDTVITFDPVQASEVKFNLKKNFASVTFTTFPADARIILDGTLVSALKNYRLDLGISHQVTVSAPFYRTREEALILQRGDSITKQILLEPAEGELSCVIEPEQAAVNIFSNRGFTSNWEGSKVVNLPVGKYSLDIDQKGFYRYNTTFEVSDQQKTSLNIELRQREFSRVNGGLFSAVCPGAGQFYAQRNKVGAVFMITTVALASTAGYFALTTSTKEHDYTSARNKYLAETDYTKIELARSAMTEKYNDYKSSAKTRNNLLMATSAVYFLNIIDAIIFTKYYAPKSGVEQVNIGIYQQSDNVGINLTCRF